MLGVLLTLHVITLSFFVSVNRKDDNSSAQEPWWGLASYVGRGGGCSGSLSSPLTSQLHTFTYIKSEQICAVTFIWGITLTAAQSLLCNSEPQPWTPTLWTADHFPYLSNPNSR